MREQLLDACTEFGIKPATLFEETDAELLVRIRQYARNVTASLDLLVDSAARSSSAIERARLLLKR